VRKLSGERARMVTAATHAVHQSPVRDGLAVGRFPVLFAQYDPLTRTTGRGHYVRVGSGFCRSLAERRAAG